MAAVLFLFLLSEGCKPKEDPEPELQNPEMSSITITGEGTTFDIIIGFSQGVYRNADKSGDLNEQSFIISITRGIATLTNYVVTHSAGQKSASIRVVFDQEANGKEIVIISPADAKSIFNSQGRSMDNLEWRAITTNGIEHQVITVKDDGNGTGTTTWTSNNIYLLDGFVFVNDGQILTIEEGTVIKGKAGQGENASALIVARGAKIIAEGTETNPIIFTSENDDLDGSVDDLAEGLWGGVIILGKAVINSDAGEEQIEGIPEGENRGLYGGNDDEDDSGIFKYVSIRHGGSDIGEGNEINGLTLGAVGSNTTIEFVEVFANKDDGVEIFGGKVNLKNIVVAFCGDDSFDYDLGYRGNGQFWVAIQGFGRGDKLGEHDGGVNSNAGQPYSTPNIFNTTYVGLSSGAGKRIASFSTNSGGHYSNSIFYHQAYGVDIELLNTDCSFDRFQNSELSINNNIFYSINFFPLLGVSAGEGVNEQEIIAANDELSAYFSNEQNAITDPGFTLGGLTYQIIPTNNVSENLADYPSGGWFEEVNYKGAFDPTGNWAEGWTLFSKYMN